MMTAFTFPNSDLEIGDRVRVLERESWGICEVIGTSHLSLVRVRRADGQVLDVGRGAVQLLDADEVGTRFDFDGTEPEEAETA